MCPFQKTEKYSYDTDFTECVESSGSQSAGCQGNQQRQRCETDDGKTGNDAGYQQQLGDGFTLASWRERLEEACRLRPNTHLLSKVKYQLTIKEPLPKNRKLLFLSPSP